MRAHQLKATEGAGRGVNQLLPFTPARTVVSLFGCTALSFRFHAIFQHCYPFFHLPLCFLYPAGISSACNKHILRSGVKQVKAKLNTTR